MPQLVPTYDNLLPGQEFLSAYYNVLMDDINTALSNMAGTEIVTPLTLSKSQQDVLGGTNTVYNWKHWFGTASIAVRDVCGFGAAGDGTTPDLAAFNAAIADLPAAGGIVLVPPGRYSVGGYFDISARPNVILLGFGSASIILVARDQTGVRMGGSTAHHQVIANLVFDAQTSGGSSTRAVSVYGSASIADQGFDLIYNCDFRNVDAGHGLDTADSVNVTIDSCRFYGNNEDIALTYQSRGIVVRNCIFTGTVLGASIRLQSPFPQGTSDPRGQLIQNCVFAHTSIPSIYILHGGDDGFLRQFEVSGCCFNSFCERINGYPTAGAIWLYTAYARTLTKNLSVQRNLFRDAAQTASAIKLTQPTLNITTNQRIQGVEISGNCVARMQLYFVDADSSSATDPNWRGCVHFPVIAGNAVSNPGTYGVRLRGGGTFYGNRIISDGIFYGNSFVDEKGSRASMQYAVYAGEDTAQTATVGNAVYNATLAVLGNAGNLSNEAAHNTYGRDA